MRAVVESHNGFIVKRLVAVVVHFLHAEHRLEVGLIFFDVADDQFDGTDSIHLHRHIRSMRRPCDQAQRGQFRCTRMFKTHVNMLMATRGGKGE